MTPLTSFVTFMLFVVAPMTVFFFHQRRLIKGLSGDEKPLPKSRECYHVKSLGFCPFKKPSDTSNLSTVASNTVPNLTKK